MPAFRLPLATIGRTGTVRSAISPVGSVHFGGELWTSELAEGEDPIPEGTEVEVIGAKGVRIIVRKV